MAPSSGGAAHDYMHKLKYILNTTPELSLPKVLAQTQVPHFAVWVDGRKSPLKFPYEEGNHFVTELRHEVMRGFRCFAAAEDTHAMNDSRTGRNDCFLCSHVWRQGSRYGVCFENSCLRSRPQGLPLTELQLNSHDDGVSTRGDASLDMDAWAGNHACCGTQARATSAYRDCQKRAAEDGGDMGSYLDFGYRTSLKAVESAFLAGAEDDLYRSECAGPSSEVVGTAFAQGILGSKCALWGGQYSYQAAPIQHFRYDEQDALTKDLSFGDGDQTFDEATTASDCNSETSYGDKTSSLSEPILEVCVNVGAECDNDQEPNKTREGLRVECAARPYPQSWSKEENEDVCAARPSSRVSWSKEENEEPERPNPSPNPPPARAGLPALAAQGTCHGQGVGSFGGQKGRTSTVASSGRTR